MQESCTRDTCTDQYQPLPSVSVCSVHSKQVLSTTWIYTCVGLNKVNSVVMSGTSLHNAQEERQIFKVDLGHSGALLPTTALQLSPRIFTVATTSGLLLFGKTRPRIKYG